MKTILVTDDLESWSFLKSSASVVETQSYLSNQDSYKNQSINIINLSRSYRYQSSGYYVSLLAEARLHDITPTIIHIQDTLTKGLYKYSSQAIDRELQKTFINIKQDTFSLSIYFGKNTTKKYEDLVTKLHNLFPLPLIRIDFVKDKKWGIKTLTPLSIQNVPEHHIKFMQESASDYLTSFIVPLPRLVAETTTEANHFSNKRFYPYNKKGTYNLAMLVEPDEGETAPSNVKAMEQFVAAGEALGLNVNIITKKDGKNITKFDALFIRVTTSVNHYTYQLARCAARDNLVVMDDPKSIILCTNKVFLAALFDKNQILTPPTQLISKYDITLPFIKFPCVLKRPDSSCSLGVVKIDDLASLKKTIKQYFKTSDMLLVQSFIPTEFDWRIGVMDNKPLYACRYYMAKNHWQIVNWNNDDCLIHDAVSLNEVPEAVIELALKSTRLIGDGLYGVDIKSMNNEHYVIEVNDNPSINFGIEDELLKNTLYEKIMNVFLQRIREKHLEKCE